MDDDRYLADEYDHYGVRKAPDDGDDRPAVKLSNTTTYVKCCDCDTEILVDGVLVTCPKCKHVEVVL